MTLTTLNRGAALLLGIVAACAAHAQGFPSKPMTLIVPYPAGGPADVTARQMEPTLRKALAQTIVIENVGGVGGALGIQKLLAAPADGHQFMKGTPSDVILAPLAISAVKHKPEQLRLVGMATRAPLMLVSGAQLPAKTVEELLAAARKPDAKVYAYGSIGLGSLYHLVAEDFAGRTKIAMTHVPYKGAAPLVQDLIGGQVDVAFLPAAGNVVDLVSQGKLHAYAVTDGKRLARLPEVPTMAEAAGLKDFDYEIWGGLFVPRGVPMEVAQRLNSVVNEALQEPEFRRQVDTSGASVGARLSLPDLEQYLLDQTARYRRLARAVKLEPQ